MTTAAAPPVRVHLPGRALLLVAGLPGAGKTTLLATVTTRPGVAVLDSSAVRDRLARRLPSGVPYPAYRWLVHLLHRASVLVAAFGRRDTVVVHLPATRPAVRGAVLALARSGGRTAHLLWLDVEPDQALAGQRQRGRVVRGPAFAGHVARAGEVVEALRDGPPAGWASARVLNRTSARRGLALDK